MIIVFLSPHFPSHCHQFCRQLKAVGANGLGNGDEVYDQLLPEIQDSLHEYYRVEDMHDYDALVRACAYFTHPIGF
jgi:hypothetical protein